MNGADAHAAIQLNAEVALTKLSDLWVFLSNDEKSCHSPVTTTEEAMQNDNSLPNSAPAEHSAVRWPGECHFNLASL